MPVYQDAVIFLGTAITLAFFGVLGAVGFVVWRRSLHRRLGALAALVSEDGEAGRSLSETLDRLEAVTEKRTIRVEVPVPVEVPVRVEVPVHSAAPAAAAALGNRASAPPPDDTAADRMRLTLGELPVGIVICDDAGKVVYRNPAAAKQVWPRRSEGANGSRKDGPGRTEPEIAEGLTAVLSEALDGRRLSRPVELEGPPRRVLRLTAVPLEEGDRLVGAMVVVEDLSDDQRDTRARRDILADLGRELVEPMVAMGVLADGLASEEDPTIRRRLADRARAESSRARRMVDDLIELGRMASVTPGDRETVRVAPLAMQSAASVAALAQQRLVDVRLLDIPADAAILGDRRQIELAMTKLLEHAVETARAGAKLEVHVGVTRTDDSARPGPSWIDIEVVDECPSMAATRPPGLTFAIVEQAARNLGGSASFLSTVDVTASVLRLPAGDPLAPPLSHTVDRVDADPPPPDPAGVTATAA